jgi:outer membrane protein TolC
VGPADGGPESYAKAAAQSRPELKQSELAVRIAEQQRSVAKASLLPQFALRGAFEANRQDFIRKGGANWLVAASLRWNIFDGYANRAQVAEANAERLAATGRQREVERHVQLEVLKAWADVRAAEERVMVSAAAVAQAEESLRIVKNRYDNGLNTVTDLLRSETALLEVRTRRLTAIHDHRVAAANLELAAGTLNIGSEILK